MAPLARSAPRLAVTLVLRCRGDVSAAPPQPRDALLNGALIGAASGAVAGVAFTHAVRDSELTFGQYARGALIFGALGAGLGLGIDALFNHGSPWPERGAAVGCASCRRSGAA